MRKEIPIVLIVFLAASSRANLASPVQAAGTIRVPQDFPTIQQAIGASSSEGTVLVAPGTYHENITVPKPLTIKGESAYSTVIEKVDAFAVCHITSDSVVITGFKISGASVGIWIDSSDLNTLSQNIIENNDDGIWVTESNGNNISNNVVFDNFFYGLYLESSNYTTLKRNNITRSIYGIYVENSRNCSIADNSVTLNDVDGVHAARSIRNAILRNTICNNSCGIYLEESSFNVIYKNNLWHNLDQVRAEGAISNNWDNGCEGNYWNDYNGTDTDGDGIGDTHLPWQGVDNCPLMNLYWNPCDINHDLMIDMKDISKAARAFGTEPGYPLWNPHADITGTEYLVPDSTVDMKDISYIAKNFGKEYH